MSLKAANAYNEWFSLTCPWERTPMTILQNTLKVISCIPVVSQIAWVIIFVKLGKNWNLKEPNDQAFFALGIIALSPLNALLVIINLVSTLFVKPWIALAHHLHDRKITKALT